MDSWPLRSLETCYGGWMQPLCKMGQIATRSCAKATNPSLNGDLFFTISSDGDLQVPWAVVSYLYCLRHETSYIKSEHPCFLLRSVGPEVLRPCSGARRPTWLFSEMTQRVSVLCCLGYSLLKCIHQSVSFHSNLQSCKYVSVRAELYDWFLWGWWDMSMALVEPSLSSGSWTFFLPW